MRIVFMGTPDFAVGTLEELIKAGHEIIGMISQKGEERLLCPHL